MSEYKRPARRPHGFGSRGMGTGEKAKDFGAAIRKLLRYMAQFKVQLLLVVLFAVGSAGFAILGPSVLGSATTAIFNGLTSQLRGGAGIDFGLVGRILLFAAGVYLASFLLSAIQGFLMSGVTQKTAYRLRRDLSEKIHRLPMRYFDGQTHGEVLSRVTNDVDTLSQSLNQSLSQMIFSATMLVGVLVMMFSISWLMTLVALAMLPLSLLATSQIVKRSQRYFRDQQRFLGDVNGQVEEVYGGHAVMQAFNAQAGTVQAFERMNENLYHSAWKSQFLSGIMQPLMNFIGNLGYVAVAVLGGVLAIRQAIEVGQIQAFIQYVRNFTQPIAQMAQIMNLLQSAAAAAERVFAFLEEEEEAQTVENPASAAGLAGSVEFSHVKFGYNPGHTIIHDFSASIQPGQKVAIVGPTGAGKTTMIKLLMRFYDVDDGAILVGGQDIRRFARSELRQLFGMVLQDTWLFHGSIRDNIRYGRLDATDEQVIAAAKAAHVHHFVQTLPEGYNMELNEEASNVSQGQKQLLTIARAILADPKILILDEATSSVDTRTELQIQKAMDTLMQGRTSFIIAHRLSTIRDADLILVMRDGDIVEQGKHEELLAKGGFYASLYNAQFERAEAI